MMRCLFLAPVLGALLISLLLSDSASAQGNSANAPGRAYGIGQPRSVDELPPGQLKRRLEGLPEHARGKALGWLQEFSFPIEDTDNLLVTDNGDVLYADTELPQRNLPVQGSGDRFAGQDIDPGLALRLHSKPGAASVLYLDFDGHILEATAWNSGTLVALPFDPAGNDSPPTEASFTQDELNRIHEIWHRVAEDYAAFDIDVTTEEPAHFDNRTGHVLITHDTDADGKAMPSQGAGGVAFIGVFGSSDYAGYFAPALVYYTNLSVESAGMPNYTADAASHEFGHNLGLSHDGVIGGTAYYEGHGAGLVSWAPIMGKLYYNNVTQWSQGEYAGANNTQDDIAIIATRLGWAEDDHGDAPALATPLIVEPGGDILVSSPQIDPENLLQQNKGVIDGRDDVDWFQFDLDAPAALSLTATPAWHSFPSGVRRGANLDIEMTLFDDALQELATADADDDTQAVLSAELGAGRHYVRLDGVGNHTDSDYSDYASHGMYFLEGLLQIAVPDSTPPSPQAMDWAETPRAAGTDRIEMRAVTATDDSGAVEYYFTCVAGAGGCRDSGWQTDPGFVAAGLDPETYYAFKVRARDGLGNLNAWSTTAGATTATPANQPPTAIAMYDSAQATITKGRTADVTLDGSGSFDTDGSIVSWHWTDAQGTAVGEGSRAVQRLRVGTHGFTLTVRDDDGAESVAQLTVVVSEAGSGSDDGSSDGGTDTGGGKGGGKGGGNGKPPKGG